MSFSSLLTSGIEFDDSEEYLEFRFRMLNAVMLTGVFFTALFIAVDLAGLNSLGTPQLIATAINCIATICLLVLLRGRKHLFLATSSLFVAVNYATYLSALVLVVNDELRVIWFFVELVVIYILLGLRAGLLMTLVTIAGVFVANRYLALPFSRNALTTLLISLCATSVITYVYTSRAISFFERLKASKIRLRELADKDPLTDLMNPRAYYEVANRMIWLAQRIASPYAVLFVDLDHFKAVNDHYGHETGDTVLRGVANCLAAHMRQSDLLGRIGGEEFSVYLPDTTLEGASKLGEKLREAVESLELTVSEGKRLAVTVSIGVADRLPTDQSITDIQRRADQAMYQAKSLGRNRIAAAP